MKKGIPAPSGAFRDWEVNFMSLVVENQVAWSIASGFVTALSALQTAWAACWAIVSTGDCTSAQRVAMRESKAAYLSGLRPFIVSQILYNQYISDAQIEQLGLKRRQPKGNIPAPTTVPVVEVIPHYVHRAKIYFRQQPDAAGVSRRGKPKGVTQVEIAYSVDNVPNGPDDCITRTISRSPYLAEFDESQAGKKVYFYARWKNAKGQGGEYTSRQEFTIP